MSLVIFQRITGLLDQEHARYRVLEHAAEGRSVEVSAIRGNALNEACKALVVRAKKSKKAKEKDFFLLAFPSDRQADFAALHEYADIRLCDPADVEELTGCVIGCVPPFSFDPRLRLLADPTILAHNMFWFNAGLFEKSIQLASADYVRIMKPEIRVLTK